MKIIYTPLLATCFALGMFSFIETVSADVICKDKKDQHLSIRTVCKKKEVQVDLSAFGAIGPEGPTGPQGPQGIKGDTGSPGEVGQLVVYGDGSAGPLTISSDTNWITSPPAGNILEFTDFTIDSQVSLTVPSGTVIRCTGNFTNNGTIRVSPPFGGGQIRTKSEALGVPGIGNADQGIAVTSAGTGEVGDDGSFRYGGRGGISLSHNLTSAGKIFALSSILHPGIRGGGAGAGSPYSFAGTSTNYEGGPGGGSITIIVKGELVVGSLGSIIADAGTASNVCQGGGGGGIVLLASKTSITTFTGARIYARGGNGTTAEAGNGQVTVACGAGGGGGGGIVHFISPVMGIGPSTTVVTAGGAGAQSITSAATIHAGGGGGGASGGNGGVGSTLLAGNSLITGATSGQDGVEIQTPADPTFLF